MERIAKMVLVTSVLVFSARSGQATSDGRAAEEKLLRDIKEGLERIDLQLMRLLDVVAPPTTTPAVTTSRPLTSSTTTTDSPAKTTDASVTTTDFAVKTTNSPATTTDSSVITTEPSTITTNPSATTTNSSVITTEPSVTTANSSAATTDSPVITTDPLSITTDPSATTTDSPVITTDTSVVTTDPSATTTDSSVITTDTSVATTNSSATTTDPSVITDYSVITTEPSATTTNSSATTTSYITTDSSAATTDSSVITTESSATTTNSSATTTSYITTDPAAATTDYPVITTDSSSITTEPSVTTTNYSPSSAATTDSPVITTDPSVTTTNSSVITTDPSSTTTNFSATTTDPSATPTPSNTTSDPSSTAGPSANTTPVPSDTSLGTSLKTPQDSSTLTSSERTLATTEDQDVNGTSVVKVRGKRSIEVKRGVREVRPRQEDAVIRTRTTLLPPAICEEEDDLCARLLEVMEGVGNVTREVNQDQETEDTLKEIHALEEDLRQVVDQVKSDPTFVERLERDALVSGVKQLQQGLDDADGTLAEKLIRMNKVSPLLLIVLASVGGGILLALLVVGVFAIHKQKKLRVEDELRKTNATSIPVQSFKEMNGYDNPSFQQDSPTSSSNPLSSSSLQQCPPPSLIPRPRSSIESYTQREPPRSSFDTRSLPNDSRPSRDPRGTYDSGQKRTPSPYYSVPRPLGDPRRGIPDDSRVRRLSGRSDAEEDLHDPYSLEGRGHNVRRVHSGRLMRIDP